MPGVAEVVFAGRRVAVHRLQVADHELRLIRVVRGRRGLGRQVLLERLMSLRDRWMRHVAGDRVVQRGVIRAALDAAVTAQRQDAAARTTDVAQQLLQDARRANDLYADGVLGPG